jgi:hypothetical protein
MRSHEAVRMVRNSVFKPGWRMEAEVYGADLILFTFYIDTVDTSYPGPDGVCRREITLIRDELMDVSRMRSVEDLFARIMRLAAETDVHEDREFLKFRQSDGSWVAPLHPHTPEGERAWRTRERTAA